MAEADGGYRGEPFYIKVPKDASSKEEAYIKTVARSRKKTANNRLKIYGILKKAFRHDLTKHSAVFRAVAVITQLNINHGFPLFDVNYVDLCSSMADEDADN